MQHVEGLAGEHRRHAASPALASAPAKTPNTQIQLRRMCDHSQRSGLRRSEF
ncbi:MAG: hypothetical protein IAE85_00295 [Anaerolinea sp.]|nr:hypothetical protein [Anaerolinea sp.]